jgi:hypothetical protein
MDESVKEWYDSPWITEEPIIVDKESENNCDHGYVGDLFDGPGSCGRK